MKTTQMMVNSLGDAIRIADGRQIQRCLLINGNWNVWL